MHKSLYMIAVLLALSSCDNPASVDQPTNPTVILHDSRKVVGEYGWTQDTYGTVVSIIARGCQDTIQVRSGQTYKTTWKIYQSQWTKSMYWTASTDTTIVLW